VLVFGGLEWDLVTVIVDLGLLGGGRLLGCGSGPVWFVEEREFLDGDVGFSDGFVLSPRSEFFLRESSGDSDALPLDGVLRCGFCVFPPERQAEEEGVFVFSESVIDGEVGVGDGDTFLGVCEFGRCGETSDDLHLVHDVACLWLWAVAGVLGVGLGMLVDKLIGAGLIVFFG
jgi:hypothetical protein